PGEIGPGGLQRARIVTGEVDGFGDFRIRLGDRLGAVDDHGADEIGATVGEHARGLVEEGAALRDGPSGPGGLGGTGGGERAVYLGGLGEGMAGREGVSTGPTAWFDQGGTPARPPRALDGEGFAQSARPARGSGLASV